jgi:hypothetical protein
MPLALNTSDPLYPVLSYLFCVDDDNKVKELRANTPLTVSPNVLLPNSSGAQSSTTPYGRSFRTIPGTSPYNFSAAAGGVGFPELLTNTNQPISVFVAINRYNSDSSAGYFSADMMGAAGPLIRMKVGGKITSATYPGVPTTGAGTTGALTTAQNTICLTRNGSGANSVFVYLNGAIDPAFAGGLSNATNQFGVTDPPQRISVIGGQPGFGWVSCDYVYFAIFVGTQLSASDVLRLHNSLTGSNRFALIAGGGASGVTFTGTVPAKSGTQGTAFVWGGSALSSFFSGGTTPYSYKIQTGTLPAGLTINTGSGVISGTPTASGSFPVVVRATDSAAVPTTADTNSFTITIATSGGAGTVVTDVISNGSGTVLANTAFNYSYYRNGRLGSLTGITPTEGAVTSDGSGRCTITGLASGSGVLLLANRQTSAATDNVYYQAVTVA